MDGCPRYLSATTYRTTPPGTTPWAPPPPHHNHLLPPSTLPHPPTSPPPTRQRTLCLRPRAVRRPIDKQIARREPHLQQRSRRNPEPSTREPGLVVIVGRTTAPSAMARELIVSRHPLAGSAACSAGCASMSSSTVSAENLKPLDSTMAGTQCTTASSRRDPSPSRTWRHSRGS